MRPPREGDPPAHREGRRGDDDRPRRRRRPLTGLADWQGRVGQSWADEWRRTERAFVGIGTALDAAIAEVAPTSGRALDIGCGVGSTSLTLAAVRPFLTVTGADLSENLIAVAIGRVREDPEVSFVTGDALDSAESLSPLDLAVSRHGVMFFADPAAAFARLRASMAPGAPLIFSCFRARHENDWAADVDAIVGTTPMSSYAPGPFAFADEAFVRDLLTTSGWSDLHAASHDVPYVVGDDPDDALAFYRRIGPAASALAAADDRGALEAKLRDLFAARSRNGAVAFTAAIHIWQATAGGEHA